ncbi:MAG TPA: gliding motility protein GldC [Parasegetibacter sp.]|jgi:gliding motility-associated protein GldC
MSHQSQILINVSLDENKIPANISWKATDSSVEEPVDAKAMMLAFWDGADKSALRIDLWTKDMMVDEMSDFFYQTIMTMADTYKRATQNEELAAGMKEYAREFYRKFRESQLEQNK